MIAPVRPLDFQIPHAELLAQMFHELLPGAGNVVARSRVFLQDMLRPVRGTKDKHEQENAKDEPDHGRSVRGSGAKSQVWASAGKYGTRIALLLCVDAVGSGESARAVPI